ncbi:MAG: hypothetical protein V4858_20505 [Pseudomonadota bacterium]
MDVNSVNKPVVQAAVAPKRPTENQQNPPVREKQAQDNETRKAEPAPAKPVVNTQGNVTGRLLNVTA